MVVNAINAGVFALGIVGIEALKNEGLNLSEGFLFSTNYVFEPTLAVLTAGSVGGMVKNIVNNIHFESLVANANKIIAINDKNGRGGR